MVPLILFFVEQFSFLYYGLCNYSQMKSVCPFYPVFGQRVLASFQHKLLKVCPSF